MIDPVLRFKQEAMAAGNDDARNEAIRKMYLHMNLDEQRKQDPSLPSGWTSRHNPISMEDSRNNVTANVNGAQTATDESSSPFAPLGNRHKPPSVASSTLAMTSPFSMLPSISTSSSSSSPSSAPFHVQTSPAFGNASASTRGNIVFGFMTKTLEEEVQTIGFGWLIRRIVECCDIIESCIDTYVYTHLCHISFGYSASRITTRNNCFGANADRKEAKTANE